MIASLRAVRIGGLAVLYGILGAGVGSAQQGANTAAPNATPAAVSAELSAADAAAAKADPDCKTADVSCAWSHCSPLASRWQSYRSCIADSCHTTDQSCVQDLIIDLNDPDRQKAMSGG